MSSRDMLPGGARLPTPAKRPVASEGRHKFGADHGLRHGGHDLDHRSYAEPLDSPPAMGASRAHMPRGGSFFSSDDSGLKKQIEATHAPDIENLNVKPVLAIVENILRLGKPSSADNSALTTPAVMPDEKKVVSFQESHRDAKVVASMRIQDSGVPRSSYYDDSIYGSFDHDTEIVRVLAHPINKISCEIICKSAAGGEAHAVTMDILKLLSNYTWDAKVVITLAAFAINYGEFWLVEHQHTRNPLAKDIATLKDLPQMMESAAELKQKFEAVLNLLNSVLNVTHCIIQFNELPPAHISRESHEVVAATTHIPTTVYWCIRSVIACASVLLNLIGSGHEYMTPTAESWEILSLTHKLAALLEQMKKHLSVCHDLIAQKQSEDAYIVFKRLMESAHIDNMKVLRAMVRWTTDDQRPLYDGSRRINERLEVLRSKYVLLLISDLDVPHEEINVLHMIYNQPTMRHEYEVLWFPIVNRSSSTITSQDEVFYELRNSSMPWYSVDHYKLVEPVAVRYIREVWNFTHSPMLVVLDPQGRPSNLNALPMMWIWGGTAFPFTRSRERALWDECTWNIDLLTDAIDTRIQDWTRANKVICLYGGEDIEWIRKFTMATRTAATALRLPLEMLYVGKRNPKEKVRRCHEVINRDKLSNVFHPTEYYDFVWYFWVRLWSMWNSKEHMGMTVENDRIMQEIMDLLAFDSSKAGWAVFSRGNFEITKGKGDIVLTVLENHATWGLRVDHNDKFVAVLDEEIKKVHPEHHCIQLILPGQTGYVPERVACSECGKLMEKFVLYSCCNE